MRAPGQRRCLLRGESLKLVLVKRSNSCKGSLFTGNALRYNIGSILTNICMIISSKKYMHDNKPIITIITIRPVEPQEFNPIQTWRNVHCQLWNSRQCTGWSAVAISMAWSPSCIHDCTHRKHLNHSIHMLCNYSVRFQIQRFLQLKSDENFNSWSC
jgi:hypothetical protein